MIEVLFICEPGAIPPRQGSEEAAGYDLHIHNIHLHKGARTATVYTGVRTAFHKNMVMLLFARSGLAAKYGLKPANAVGVVDADYRGEIMIKFNNLSDLALEYLEQAPMGTRIAQAVFTPVIHPTFRQVDTLPDSVRGEGGFGSTGS